MTPIARFMAFAALASAGCAPAQPPASASAGSAAAPATPGGPAFAEPAATASGTTADQPARPPATAPPGLTGACTYASEEGKAAEAPGKRQLVVEISDGHVTKVTDDQSTQMGHFHGTFSGTGAPVVVGQWTEVTLTFEEPITTVGANSGHPLSAAVEHTLRFRVNGTAFELERSNGRNGTCDWGTGGPPMPGTTLVSAPAPTPPVVAEPAKPPAK